MEGFGFAVFCDGSAGRKERRIFCTTVCGRRSRPAQQNFGGTAVRAGDSVLTWSDGSDNGVGPSSIRQRRQPIVLRIVRYSLER